MKKSKKKLKEKRNIIIIISSIVYGIIAILSITTLITLKVLSNKGVITSGKAVSIEKNTMKVIIKEKHDDLEEIKKSMFIIVDENDEVFLVKTKNNYIHIANPKTSKIVSIILILSPAILFLTYFLFYKIFKIVSDDKTMKTALKIKIIVSIIAVYIGLICLYNDEKPMAIFFMVALPALLFGVIKKIDE